MIKGKCQNCNKAYTFYREYSGTTVCCLHCRQAIKLPGPVHQGTPEQSDDRPAARKTHKVELPNTEHTIPRVELPSTMDIRSSDDTYRLGIILGIVAGMIAFVGGIILSILGINGNIDLILKGPGLTAHIINGTPGAAIGLLGLLVLWKYKPRTEHSISSRTISEHWNVGSNTKYRSTTSVREQRVNRSELRSRP